MAKLKITHHDNRGDKYVPYGFVYFNDDTRIGYAPYAPITTRSDGLFSGHWGGNTPAHFAMALKYLKEKGVMA